MHDYGKGRNEISSKARASHGHGKFIYDYVRDNLKELPKK